MVCKHAPTAKFTVSCIKTQYIVALLSGFPKELCDSSKCRIVKLTDRFQLDSQ